MARGFVDGTAPTRRRAVALAPAMLAIIRERGPIDHIAALHRLKADGRVRLGVTLAVGRAACELLERDGAIERDGAWKWRVPSDSAVILSDHERHDGESPSPIAA